MKRRSFKAIYAINLLVICVASFSTAVAQTKILDEKGNWNGLYNMNPDPLGEQWIVGNLPPMTKEQQAEYDALPTFTAPKNRKAAPLPPTCDNSIKPEFRPIFSQIGGSCGQASGMAYVFTFERNLVLGTTAAATTSRCSYGFMWNMLNSGAGNGTWPSAGFNVAKEMGCAHVADFKNTDNGGSGTAWMDGYEGYLNGNDCHVTEQVKFQPTDITGMKNWFYDKGTGTGTGGGIVTFVSNVTYPTVTIGSGPYKGQKLCTGITDGTAHAQTFAGYSDEISHDVNGDGQISSTEKGAILLVNSWGTSWMNAGKLWVLYSGIKCNNIIGVKVAKYETKIMLKAKITSTARNSLVMKTGFAKSLTATVPDTTKGFAGAFNKSGGALPMAGSGASSTITIGLDCTPFAGKIMSNGGKGTVFLQISGNGTVNQLSAMDYTTTPPRELPYKSTDVALSGTMNLGIPLKISTAVEGPVAKAPMTAAAVSVKKAGGRYTLQVSRPAQYAVTVATMQGKTVESFATDGVASTYEIGGKCGTGVYLVTVRSARESFSTKINVIR